MSSFFGPKAELFRSLRPLLSHPSYGGGFSYSDVFDTWNGTNAFHPHVDPLSAKATMMIDPVLQHRLDTGYFNTIIFTNAANKYYTMAAYFQHRPVDQQSLLYRYQQQYNPLVIVVDGSDSTGCHIFPSHERYELHYHFHFIREYDVARKKMMDDPQHRLLLPHGWSGCLTNPNGGNATFHPDS
jgi:hypothetical protein